MKAMLMPTRDAAGSDLRIVSGGQSGVDRAALDAALCAGLAVGGWCPRGRRAEDGTISALYPLRETPSGRYGERTEWNVRDSDATLIIGRLISSRGTALTRRLARMYDRPVLEFEPGQRAGIGSILDWMQSRDIRVLNVAGPRESESPGIYDEALSVLDALFEAWQNRP